MKQNSEAWCVTVSNKEVGSNEPLCVV